MTNIDNVSLEDLKHQFERLDARTSLLCLLYGHLFDRADRDLMRMFGYVTPDEEDRHYFNNDFVVMAHERRKRILELGL